MSKIPGAKLVGRRIDENTPLGRELVRLREFYGLAAGKKLTESEIEKMRLAALNASVNVRLQDGIERDRRKRAIAKQLGDAIHAAYLEHGKRPTSIGVDKRMVEEARAALKGTEYESVKVVPER